MLHANTWVGHPEGAVITRTKCYKWSKARLNALSRYVHNIFATKEYIATFWAIVRNIRDGTCRHCFHVMHSSRDQAAGTRSFGDDDGSSCCLLREAEFAVASAISVREQQKARLLAMVAALSPPPQATGLTTRQRLAPFRRGQVNSPPSLHVLGDILLLLRAASVNVVERVQAWRQHLHQGRPRPYLHDNQNYLLVMCQDTDFLDNVSRRCVYGADRAICFRSSRTFHCRWT